MERDKPFDRSLRRLRRERAARRFADADYLHRRVADELLDRLEGVRRPFADALVLGAMDGYLAGLLRARGIVVTEADPGKLAAVQSDEDMLPFGDGAFDLVVSVGVLDTVNDLPGALALILRALRPGGLFLGAMAGAGSLPRLRSAMLAADEVHSAAGARLHPQIDVRAAGDLLARAGFALPVADTEAVTVRFASLPSLIDDLREMAGTSVLADRPSLPLGRIALAAAMADFASHADPDGKVGERFEILYLTGWAS